MTVYPTCYLEIYRALIAPVPFDKFNPQVQSVLAAMAEFNLVRIDAGVVTRTFNGKGLCKDFRNQLKMRG